MGLNEQERVDVHGNGYGQRGQGLLITTEYTPIPRSDHLPLSGRHIENPAIHLQPHTVPWWHVNQVSSFKRLSCGKANPCPWNGR
mmetsp:Transcript_37018/g.86063  ORF Transcript_37018/g.86063 Transcript_37018/m.86063 type:complete len:85 (-) Transcript_37018:88-342(-)